ncbi:methyltransferase, partial [Streptococcus pneumoniae]|uniref:methyltransferase n=1 Tax=Streptococcus pneumoniae TaxID=1313 RepID=UPI001885A531
MYYAENPDAAHDIHELRVDLLGEKMTFLTDAGVFSKKMVDFGSQLLLKCLDVNQGETVHVISNPPIRAGKQVV